jgi:hypothetical protein
MELCRRYEMQTATSFGYLVTHVDYKADWEQYYTVVITEKVFG